MDVLRTEHFLQLALYALMTNCEYEYRLYNIKSGEIIQLQVDDMDNLRELADKLIEIKSTDVPLVSESEFMQQKQLPDRGPKPVVDQAILDMMNDL